MSQRRLEPAGAVPRRLAPGLLLLVAAGCAVGQGQGEVSGTVITPAFCGLSDEAYELHPSFFGGEVVEETLNVRVQRGSAIENRADGLVIFVRDVDEVRRDRIGLPIAIDAAHTSFVQVVFYLNESCPAGFPNTDERNRPVVLEAHSGTITFDAIYAPAINAAATLTEARFEGLTFLDPDAPEERQAVLDGWFSFFYQRGGPAQRFP